MNDISKPKLILVVSQQRSGSTWLCDLLYRNLSSEVLVCGEMFLRAPRPNDWKIRANAHLLENIRFHEWKRKRLDRSASLDNYLVELGSKNNATHIVIKVMYRQLITNPSLWRWLFGRAMIVHLFRKNALEVIVSRERMRRTDIAHSDRSSTQPPIKVNLLKLPLQLFKVIAGRHVWSLFLRWANNSVSEVRYEDVLRDPMGTITNIASVVGLNSVSCSKSKLVRISPEPISKRITNEKAVRGLLSLCRAEWMLGD